MILCILVFVCFFLSITFLGTPGITKCSDIQNDKYNHFHEMCEEFEAGSMYRRLHVNVSV